MSRGLQGLRAWLLQRITAVYLAVFTLLAVLMFAAAPEGFNEWHRLLSHPLALILIGLFYVALLLHAWIGGRDVIIDYVHPLWVRVTAYVLFAGFLLGCSFWAAKVLILATMQ